MAHSTVPQQHSHDAGVVDPDIDGPNLGLGLSGERKDVGPLCHVGDDAQTFGARLLCRCDLGLGRHQVRRPPCSQDHVALDQTAEIGEKKRIARNFLCYIRATQ